MPQQRFRITARDLAVLRSLATAGYLTAQAIEWLHWPERLAVEQAAIYANEPYYPTSSLYTRLRWLTKGGFVQRLIRSVPLGQQRFGREPDIYMLTEQGRTLLLDSELLDETVVVPTRERPRSVVKLAHYVEAGQCYAALAAKIATMRGVSLEDWQSEHQTTRAYDRLPVSVPRENGSTTRMQQAVQPDGTGRLLHGGGTERLFVEWDRGRRPYAHWAPRIAAYHAYMNSVELARRYQTDRFVLLTVVPTRTRLTRFLEITASVLTHASGRYLFALAEDIHPLRIGSAWHKLTQVTIERGKKVQIETGQHVLLP